VKNNYGIPQGPTVQLSLKVNFKGKKNPDPWVRGMSHPTRATPDGPHSFLRFPLQHRPKKKKKHKGEERQKRERERERDEIFLAFILNI
jgi:hypothetical protein